MPMTEDEATAGLRILVAIAKADGKIDPGEKAALAEALAEAPLGAGTTVDELLAESAPFDDALSAVRNKPARDDVFKAAYAMANADGSCAPEEQLLLDRIRVAWDIPAEDATTLARLFAEPHAAELVAASAPAKPELGSSVDDDIVKFSLGSAVLGAFPVPGLAILADLAVVAIQLKMVQEIGAHFEYRVDRTLAKSLLYGLGLGTGTRIAVSNLVKLVPGWGSAFGAASSFATTFALGKVMEKYFADGGTGDTSGMRGDLEAARKQARASYGERAAEVEAWKREKQGQMVVLAKDLDQGKITRAEYESKVAGVAAR
jgi:uncharacterized protein (DUF697 family)